MSTKFEQLESIAEAVKEQLGIEEEDYYNPEDDYVQRLESQSNDLEVIREEISVVREELVCKDKYIQKLEKMLMNEMKRLDLLERKFCEFRRITKI